MLLALLALSQPASAQSFDAGRALYCVPSCPFAAEPVESALERAALPIYVLYTTKIGRGDPDEAMRGLADRTITAWQRSKGFDSARSTVIAIGVSGDKHGMWVTPGSEVQTRISNWEQKDDEIFDSAFAPKARLSDYGGAIVDYAEALDRWLVEASGTRWAREHLAHALAQGRSLEQTALPDALAAAVRQADATAAAVAEARVGPRPEYHPETLEAAASALDTALQPAETYAEARETGRQAASTLAGLLGASPLPDEDPAPYQAAIDAEKSAEAQGDPAAMQRATGALTERLHLYQGLVQAHEAAQRSAAQRRLIAIVSASLLGLVGLGLLGARMRRVLAQKLAFDEELSRWRARVSTARSNFGELLTERDMVRGLREKRGETRALYDEVSALLDEVVVDLEALDAHLRRQEALASKARFYDAAPLGQAMAGLTEEFAFDAGMLAPQTLFGEPAALSRRVAPTAFQEKMEAAFGRARGLWTVVTDAHRAARRSAREDLPREPLDELSSRLEAGGVDLCWLHAHPLWRAEPLWDELDALRAADPVAYVRRLGELRQQVVAVTARAAGVLGRAIQVGEAEVRADRPLDLSVTVLDGPDQDPAALDAQRSAARAAWAAALGVVDQVRFEGASDALMAVLDEIDRRKSALEAAIANAERGVEAMGRGVDSVQGALERAEARYQALVGPGRHAVASVVGAHSELTQAGEDLGVALAAAEEARVALEGRRHLSAVNAASRAVRACKDAMIDLEEFAGIASEREAQRARFDAALAGADAARAQRVQRMRGYGSHADPSLFAHGDAELATLRAGIAAAPQDWAEANGRLDAVLAAWDRAVEIVDNRKDVADADRVVEEARGHCDRVEMEAREAAGLHGGEDLARLNRQIQQSLDALSQARRQRDEARALLAAGDDRAAETAAFSAMKQASVARDAADQARAQRRSMDEARQRYLHAREALSDSRRRHASELAGYHYARSVDLSRGDALLRSLPDARGLSWATELAQLSAIELAWSNAVAQARRHHQDELDRQEAERRRQEEARRRAREEADRAASAASISSSYSSHGSHSSHHSSSSSSHHAPSQDFGGGHHGGHGHHW